MSVYRERRQHRLQQHGLRSGEHERGDQPGVHVHGRAGEEQYFLYGRYASVDASSETSTAYDYNDYFSASGTPFSWGGTAYTFANWKTNSAQDAHSLNSDPTLTNARPSREFYAARRISGDRCGRESGIHVSAGAFAVVFVARRSGLVESKQFRRAGGRWARMCFRRTGRRCR